MKTILDRLSILEQNNAKLEERLKASEVNNSMLQEGYAELRASNVELQESNVELRESNDRVEAMLQTTMEAVLGVSDNTSMYIFLCTHI
jgi:uncharacterized protein YdaT